MRPPTEIAGLLPLAAMTATVEVATTVTVEVATTATVEDATIVTAEATSVPSTAVPGGRATVGGTEEGRGRGAGVPRGGAGATRGASALGGGTARGRTADPRGRSRRLGKDGELRCAWPQHPPLCLRCRPLEAEALEHDYSCGFVLPPLLPLPQIAPSTLQYIQYKQTPFAAVDLSLFSSRTPKTRRRLLIPTPLSYCLSLPPPPPPSSDLGFLNIKVAQRRTTSSQQIGLCTRPRLKTTKIARSLAQALKFDSQVSSFRRVFGRCGASL